MSDDNKLLRELGLSTLFLTSLFIAIFAASGAVAEEIENKTVMTVLTKPVQRPIFILGKFLGVTAAVILAHFICTVALLMAIRHGVLESVSDEHDWTVIVAASVTVLAVFIITAFLNYSYDWNFPATAIVLTSIFATFCLSPKVKIIKMQFFLFLTTQALTHFRLPEKSPFFDQKRRFAPL